MGPRRQQEVFKLPVGENYKFSEYSTGIRVMVEWISTNGIICDLDLNVYFYDERARFIEKLNFDHPTSTDGSSTLEADVDSHATTSSHQENVLINFTKVDPATAAILLFVDGGPRNFQFVQNLIVHFSQENADADDAFLPMDPSGVQNPLLFQIVGRGRKEFQGVALGVFFKDGWHANGTRCWSLRNLFEPVYVPTSREKDEKCGQFIISTVPALDKYRPRLFANVKAICSALSSTSLPKLKKSFQRGNGLPLKQFTEVLFAQLYETHPKVVDEQEAAYTVAMLQDMFSQIDFNGDGAVDWDEFTTFCIHTGLVGSVSAASGVSDSPNAGLNADALDNYVIQYGEDTIVKDHVINSYTPISVMRYLHDMHRIMVIQEKSEKVLMVNDSFHLVGELSHAAMSGGLHEHHDKHIIYDIVYLTGKDLYAYCASDHTIVMCKEQSSMGGRRIHHTLYNRIFHNVLHLKLCWGESCKLLCSVGANNDLYGWEIDSQVPLFQINRHNDLVTDFLAIDKFDLFVTCSLDKRIVLWSMTSRRVKGVLQGHKRGVRCLSYAKDVLLSAGFECEAKTWDLVIKEPTLILRGHRYPIAAVKMMCAKGQTDDNLRAITVDDSGEFRLWNVFVKEKGSGQALAPTLQVFHINSTDTLMSRVGFIELPFNQTFSKGNYSNLIAASTKLTHFIPEKSSKEFVPPTCSIFNEPSACIATTIGKHVFKYDICNGQFISHLSTPDTGDLTCLCLDGEFGRRMYLGTSGGNVMLVNFSSGQVIDSIQAHSKEVSCILATKSSRNLVFTGSLDGRIRVIEENSGALTIHNTAENALGDGCGVNSMKVCIGLKVLLASSTGCVWGLWNFNTLKKLFILQEELPISSVAVVASTEDQMDPKAGANSDKEHIITVAIAMQHRIRVYTIDIVEVRASISFLLENSVPRFISQICVLDCPSNNAVNYSLGRDGDPTKLGKQILAVTDEGEILVWNGNEVKKKSLEIFRKFYANMEDSKTRNNRRFSQIVLRSTESIGGIAPQESSASTTIQQKAPFADSTTELEPSSRRTSISSFDFFDSRMNNTEETFITGTDVAEDATVQPLMRTLSCVSLYEICKSVVEGEMSKIRLQAHTSWKAHQDIISSIVPLHEHGCLVTISLDGYHRIWNMDRECLGEMPLPNLTEKMKVRRLLKDEQQNWKFILERIPVTKNHIDIANHLIHELCGTKIVTAEEARVHDRRKAAVNSIVYNTKPKIPQLPRMPTALSLEEKRKAAVRNNILKSLQDPFPSDDDSTGTPIYLHTEAEIANTAHVVGGAKIDHVAHKGLATFALQRQNTKQISHRLGVSADEDDSPPPMSVRSLESAINIHDQSSTIRSARPSNVWLRGPDSAGGARAFTPSSIRQGEYEGSIDGEGHKILGELAKRPDRMEVYSRPYPDIMIRATSASTKVRVPSANKIDTAEVSFGAQKDMYVNAKKVINRRGGRISTARAQHVVSVARIKQSVRHAGEMIHVPPSPNHDALILPPLSALDVRSGQPTYEDDSDDDSTHASLDAMKHKRRQTMILDKMKLEKRVLNKEKLKALMDKVSDAMITGISEEEMRGTKKLEMKERERLLLRRLDSNSQLYTLEKKLMNAIRAHFHDGEVAKVPKLLTNRMLLPFYKLADVQHFLDIFQKVDEDYSGDLDPNEWVKFLTTLNKTISTQQARSVFMQVDVNNNGVLSIRDLIPVVFSKANKETQRNIIKYVDSEVSKRKNNEKDIFSENDLEKLFEIYDTNVVGFVPISVVRDKIRGMQLAEEIHFTLLRSIQDMEDDEMVNLAEFQRIFRPYLY